MRRRLRGCLAAGRPCHPTTEFTTRYALARRSQQGLYRVTGHWPLPGHLPLPEITTADIHGYGSESQGYCFRLRLGLLRVDASLPVTTASCSRMTPLTHQAVQVGTGQAALMPRVLEGNRGFGHASQNSVVNTHRGSRPIREMSTLPLLSVGHGELYLYL